MLWCDFSCSSWALTYFSIATLCAFFFLFLNPCFKVCEVTEDNRNQRNLGDSPLGSADDNTFSGINGSYFWNTIKCEIKAGAQMKPICQRAEQEHRESKVSQQPVGVLVQHPYEDIQLDSFLRKISACGEISIM